VQKSKTFINMPVVSLEDGQQVGFVKDIVVNPAKLEIAGLVVEQKGWFKEQKIIPYNKVFSIGGDAITIEKSSHVEKPANLPEIINLMKNKTLVTGSRVVTEDGAVLGRVDEFYVDEATGKMTGLDLSDTALKSIIKGKRQLDISFVKTIGKEILIACSKAGDHLIKTDGGLQENMNNIRESTANLLETTFTKAKKAGQNLREYTKKTISLRKQAKAKNSCPEDTTIDHISPVEPEEVLAMEEEIAGIDDSALTETSGFETSETCLSEESLPAESQEKPV